MQFKTRLWFKDPKRQFRVEKSFTTKSEITKREIEVSEAFGIGMDEEKRFTVFKDFAVEIDPRDVLFITGDSGGGKSVLLRELREQMASAGEFGRVLADSELDIDPNEILIEGVGSNTNSAMSILSQAGLNEAFLMLRRYRELSDGQKYRYKIAKMLDSRADTWLFDEFVSMLDRVTAKIVSYCVQKVTRKFGKTVIVATTHPDLFDDINPSIYIEKGFGDSVRVKRYEYRRRPCSILKEIVIEEGTKEDYEKLKEFHYKAGTPLIILKIFTARLNDEPVGAIVYVPSQPKLKGRGLCLPAYRFGKMTKQDMQMLNRGFVRIGRVVVHPKFRSIGLGILLVKDTMPLMNKPYVETLAVMARYNPFFERAGMLHIPTEIDNAYGRKLLRIEEMGFSLELLPSKNYCLGVTQRLSAEELNWLRKFVLTEHFKEKYNWNDSLISRIKSGEIEALAAGLSRQRLKAEYLIWKNPKFSEYPEPFFPLDRYSPRT